MKRPLNISEFASEELRGRLKIEPLFHFKTIGIVAFQCAQLVFTPGHHDDRVDSLSAFSMASGWLASR